MRTLIVEDDFTSRTLLQRLLEPYGKCDVAVNGEEALEAFRQELEVGRRYDLVCLDIMLPEMDGHGVLEKIREMEEEKDIQGLDGAKVMMTSVLGDKENVMKAFRAQCEAYLVKPIDKTKLLSHLRDFGLVK